MCQGIKVSRFLIVLYSLFLFSLPAFADTPHDQQLVQLVHQFKASRANDEATRAQIKALIQKRRAWLKQNTRSAPSVAVQDGSWDGQVSAVVVDLADERGQITGTRDEYHLHLSTGSVRLLLIDGAPLGMQKNPRVHVEGVKVDNWIIPEKISPTNVPSASGAGIAATMALAAPACATTGDQKAIVIAVNWQDDTTASPAATTLNDRYFAPTQSLANYWTEASYGKLRLTGDTFGWFTVNIPTASACDSVLVRQKALEVVAPYTDLTTYNRIFLVMRNPTPGCGWAGLGELSCSTFTTPDGPMMANTHWILSSYFNQPNLAVWLAAHEAGHNLGLHHAAVRDYGANAIGPVGGSNSGQLVEYGDRYDSMGTYTAPNHYNANHKYNLGWLTDADIVPVNGNRTVLLEPMSTPITGIKATRIYRGVDPTYFTKEYLWLETRQPKGYDAFMDARGYGSIIVHHQTATSGIKTENLDLHPSISTAVSDYLDAPLASGESFTDPYSLIKITHAGVDASGKVTTVITQDAGKIDTDEDGLPNSVEALYGSNPNLVDTDGDGVTDYREVCYDGDCLHYNPAPAGGDINLLKSDTDGDGLNDGYELQQSYTSPIKQDTDGDGLSDASEINQYRTNPNLADTDGDGLTDYAEIMRYKTSALFVDTDGDGASDGYEVAQGTNPLHADVPSAWNGSITGRITTPAGKGVAGITFWDVTKYPQTTTTDENGYFVVRGYTGGETVYFNVSGTNSGYTLRPSDWNGQAFVYSGGAVVARNYTATLNLGTVSGRIALSNGTPLAGITFWDVTKYPQTITTRADGGFVSQGYSAGNSVYFNISSTNSGYTLAPLGWSGQPFIHNGSALSGYNYVATQNPGTISGRVTTPDGKPVAGIKFWDVSKYPATVTTGADGRFMAQGYKTGDTVFFNLWGASANYTFVPAGWNGQGFQHNGGAIMGKDYVAVPKPPVWGGTISGQIKTPEGKGVAGIRFWDVSRYPQTITTDENGYFAAYDYLAGQSVWFNIFATNSGYSLSPAGWDGQIFVHKGRAAAGLNYIATLNTGTVSGRIALRDGIPLAGITFWDVSRYPKTITTQADGGFVSPGYSAGNTIYFNTLSTKSGYTLAPAGWNGQSFTHNGAVMTGYNYIASQNADTVSGRIITPDGKPVAGIKFWDVSKYPATVTTGTDGRFMFQEYEDGDSVLFNLSGTGSNYTFMPSGWNGQAFKHKGSAITGKDYVAVPK